MTDEIDLSPEALQTPAEFDSSVDGLRSAARALKEERQAPEVSTPEVPSLQSQDVQPPIIEVGFLDQNGKVSEDVGPPSLTAHKAAKLIGDWRDEQAAYLKAVAEQQQNYPPQVAAPEASASPPSPSEQPPPAADPYAAQAAAIEAQTAQQWQQLGAYRAGLQNAQQALLDVVLRESPELAGIAALQNRDPIAAQVQLNEFRAKAPDRFARYEAMDRAFRQNAEQAAMIDNGTRAEAQRQFTAYAEQQDDLFMQAHPEFQDRATFREMQDAAVEYCQAKGVSKAQLAQAWHSDPTFRSAAAQSMLLDAVKGWRAERAQQRAAQSLRDHRKPLPQVVRPGVAVLASERTSADLETLGNRLAAAKGDRAALLAATALYKATKAAAR